MKKLILDEPIRDSLADYLDQGENIHWQGISEVRKNFHFPDSPLEEFLESLALFNMVLYHIFYKIINPLWVKLIHIGKNKSTTYAITSQRIIFKLGHWKKNTFQDILFSQIKNLIVTTDEKNKVGTIFLVVKDPSQINFETFEIINHKKSEKRHQPTLENLPNIEEVAQLIRQGIKNANK